MSAVITAQDQFARRWTSLVVEPGSRSKTFDQMRQDFKQYLVDIAGIPERAVLEYLQRLSDCAGPTGEPPSPESTFRDEADGFTQAAADLYAALTKVSAARPTSGGAAQDPAHAVQVPPVPAHTAQAHAAQSHTAPDPLGDLSQKLAALLKAQAKLGAGTAPPAS